MASYRVSFFKNVSDDTGHDHRACQATVEVDAPEADDATTAAQARFCTMHDIADWRSYADEIEVETTVDRRSADPACSHDAATRWENVDGQGTPA